jgi:soluble cytochrome b562
MKQFLLILILAPVLLAGHAQATTVKDFEAKTASQQGALVADFVDKMTTGLGVQNPQLAQAIRDYFSQTQAGKHLPDGIERLAVEMTTVDDLAKEGKADPAKIQVESMIVYLVKQKFQPPTGQK